MQRGSIFWGIMLVLLGGLFLAQNFNLLPPTVNVWSIFWALLLVGFGVGLLLRSMDRGTMSSGTVVRPGDMVVPGSTPTPGAVRTATPVTRGEAVRVPLGGARQAALRFHHGAGELRIDANAAPDELFSGTFAGGLDHQERQDGDQITADLRVPGGSFPVIDPFDSGQRLDWTVGLNPVIPLTLDFEVGASRNLLNLRDLQVKDLRLQTGASATEIDFPARAGETRASLHSGVASVEVRIPENVSARIRTRGGLSAINVDTARFPQVGQGECRSPDFEVSANRVDMEVESGVGSVNIR